MDEGRDELFDLLERARRLEIEVLAAKKAVEQARTALNRAEVEAANAWIAARKAFARDGLLEKLWQAK